MVPKKATFLQLAFLIYGAVCAGAYGLEDMISSAGPGVALVTLIVTPLVYCLPIAFAVGELTAAFPVEGGNYRWSRMALGDFWGFQAAWWAWMTGVMLSSMFAVLFANYLQNWLPGLVGYKHWLVCLGVIWAIHGLNVRGIQAVGNSAIVLSLIILAPFLIMTALGIHQWRFNPLSPFVAPGKSVFGGFSSAVVLTIWLYAGFDKLSAAAEEVENPSRNFPPALFAAAALTMLSYVVPTVAALASQGDWGSWSGAYFPVVAAKIGGPGLGAFMLLGALCSNVLLLNVTMLSVSRIPLTLAQDGILPAAFARHHPKFQTPTLALTLGSAVYSLFCLFDFTQLTIINSWFQMASYMLLYINVWVLRRSRPDAPRTFKVPFGRPGLYTAMGLTGLLTLLAASSAVFKDGTFAPFQALIGVLALLSGPAIYRALSAAKARGAF